ncbi:MAG TPA: hypothetical protein VN130_02635 [Xanthobacteraceae bacterium]|nr:hypothetical protein [Xanthobacteraceae bacterium]
MRREGQYAAAMPHMGPFYDWRNDFARPCLFFSGPQQPGGSSMALIKIILAGSMLTALGSVALGQGTPPLKESPPPPPGMQTGIVRIVNRLNGTVVIEPTKESAKNANPDAAAAKAAAEKAAEKAAAERAAAEEASAERLKIKRELIDGVHAGDKIKFSVTESNGAKTITKIEAD